MMRARLRRGWVALHRWIGLGFGALLLLAALTGLGLLLAKPLHEATLPRAAALPAGGGVPLDTVVARLRREFGDRVAFTLRLPLGGGDTLRAGIAGRWKGTLHFDPGTGRELARQADGEGFFATLFELHSTLLAGDAGRALLATAALAYLAMLVSGLVLWWPVRWRRAFSVRRGAGLLAGLFDLHRVAGAVLGVLVLVSVASGAYMAWKPLAAWLTVLGGQRPAAAPALPPADDRTGTREGSLEAALQRVRSHWPEGVVSAIHIPARSPSPVRVRVRLPDDPHPIGMSTAWVDPRSGALLEARRWSDIDLGSRAYSIMYPLHIGSLAGAVTWVTTLLAGIALAVLGSSGAWLWWRRRGTRPAGPARP